MTITLNIGPVETVLRAHGAAKEKFRAENPGKPVSQDYGVAIFASAIVLMSAMMQSYVEDVFKKSVKKKFLHIKTDDDVEKFWKLIGQWGNPTKDNINKLFLRVGIINVMEGFCFDSNDPEIDSKYLSVLNFIRNKIAHGNVKLEYRIGDERYKLTQGEVWSWLSFVNCFGQKFEAHVEAKLL